MGCLPRYLRTDLCSTTKAVAMYGLATTIALHVLEATIPELMHVGE